MAFTDVVLCGGRVILSFRKLGTTSGAHLTAMGNPALAASLMSPALPVLRPGVAVPGAGTLVQGGVFVGSCAVGAFTCRATFLLIGRQYFQGLVTLMAKQGS